LQYSPKKTNILNKQKNKKKEQKKNKLITFLIKKLKRVVLPNKNKKHTQTHAFQKNTIK
jgi:hypothetical protein